MVKKVQAPPKIPLVDGGRMTADMVDLFGKPPTAGGQYLHWDQIRHRQPPAGMTAQQWWFSMKMARMALSRPLAMPDPAGLPFRYSLTPAIEEGLHWITSLATGRVAMPSEVTESGPKERFLVRSIIEEAITSSQLEGASTTRRAAIDMFRSGRQPSNRSERMIFNNLRGMRFIVEHKDDDLTPELVCEIHRLMTSGTIADEAAGRIQRPDDERIAVFSNTTQEVLHQPPPAAVLPQRLEAMCDFANDSESGEFLNPIIRSIALHFWLAYDHPFVDGNGRTARALFYWSMLKHGYWLFEYISISTALKKSAAQYGRAFQYVETDERDLTYFIIFHLKIIRRAMTSLNDYLAAKAKEIAEAEKAFKASGQFNYRQLALLSHELRRPGTEYTVQSHSVSHGITPVTARTDLRKLVAAGLLEERQVEGKRGAIFVAVGKHARR
jgi:Fic family protein